jgi:putative serine protease PepD
MLTEKVGISMSDGSTTQNGAEFCRWCGEEQPSAGTYCVACGKPRHEAAATQRAWIPLTVGGLVVALGLIAASVGFVVLSDDNAGTSDAPSEVIALTDTTTTTSATTSAPSTTVPGPEEFDDVALVSQFGDAVFKIETTGCGFEGTGSGFAIDSRHIVTNKHVVDVDTTPTVYSRDGQRYTGRVIGWEEDPDIALIQVDTDLPVYLDWADSNLLTEGQRTVSLGYPLPDHDFSVTPGVVISFVMDGARRAGIRSDGQLDRGNSGGPSLVSNGAVAGVVTQVDLNLDGFQLVPIILPSNDASEVAEWIINHPSRPSAECSSVNDDYYVAPPLPDDGPSTGPEWPTPFYTVILASMQTDRASFADAESRARDLADAYGFDTYVLNSNEFTSLSPGFWVVYTGPMEREDSKKIAELFRDYGIDAYAKQVSRWGE